MNKQEAIEKLQSEARHHCGEKECYKDGCTKNVELDIAIDIVKQLDGPERPVVPQFVADWYEEHAGTDFEYNLYLLYIDYYEQKLEGNLKEWIAKGSKNKAIQTLVLMHQLGYEVKNKKQYIAKFEASNEYLNFDKNYKKLHWVHVPKDVAENCSNYHFTKETLIKYSMWENPAFDIDEVKNDSTKN